jgi:DNA-binding MarR family transcriptional regulator
MDTTTGCDWRGPDIDGVDELSARVFEAWIRTAHLQRQFAMRALPDTEVHPGQARCLWAIAGNDGITLGDLAEMLHLARPTVSIMVSRLEEAGLVAKAADPDDQRLTRLAVTPEGRELEGRLRAFHRTYINETIGALSESDRLELERLLGLMRANIETAIARQDGATA